MSVVIRQSELRNDNAAVMRRVAEAFATEPVRDPTAWHTDLAAADEVLGMDEPTGPFERRRH